MSSLNNPGPVPDSPLPLRRRSFLPWALATGLAMGAIGFSISNASAQQLPTLGKGARNVQLSPQLYDATGIPLDTATFTNPPARTPNFVVRTAAELRQALLSARAGQVIHVSPGTYRITQRLDVAAGGTPTSPIILTATPGTAVIEMDTIEGFRVTQPYWIFENLVIRGVCADDNNCEHAFHVVANAKGVVIRNNRLENFNAQIKVNGENGLWPDFGLVHYNTLYNSRPRVTWNPVTPIDLVGANQWRYADNVISNFIHTGGNGISYGAFMKGASQKGRIERNLIVCTDPYKYYPGAQVGMSFGGGGTGPSFCRDKTCAYEHTQGTAVNNVIAHCNDSGIDVNRSSDNAITHNLLINTIGIDLRNAPASARVYGNVLEGRIAVRSGAVLLDQRANVTGSVQNIYMAPYALDLRWRSPFAQIYTAWSAPQDFCRIQRAQYSLPGPFGSTGACPQPGVVTPGGGDGAPIPLPSPDAPPPRR